MKRSSNKKDHVVVHLDDFNNTWKDVTIPCTSLQAIRWVVRKNYTHLVDKGAMRIVTLAEFAELPKGVTKS